MTDGGSDDLAALRKRCPDKFSGEAAIFGRIRRGDRIFVGTGCGEPQRLVRALAAYVESNPKAFFGTENIHVLIARKQGLVGLTAEVLRENEPMLRVYQQPITVRTSR